MSGTKESFVEAQVIEFAGSEQESRYNWVIPTGSVEKRDSAPSRVKKESQQDVDDLRGHTYLQPRYSPLALIKLMEHNVWHARCVRLKANLVAGLGWQLVTEEENKDEDIDYKRIMQFLENPNEFPETTFTEISVRTLIDYFATGNGYVEVSRNLKNEPVYSYPVRANTMRRSRHLRSGGYYQLINGTLRNQFNNYSDSRTDKSKNEMLHFYQYDPLDDFYGTPEWIAAMADMVQDRAYVEYTLNLFKNQMLAKFLIIVEGGRLDDSSKKTIKKFLEKQTSVKNAGGTVVLSSDDSNVKIRIERIDHSFEAKDGSSSKGNIRSFARDVVIASHGVLPRMVGVMTAGQLGGGGENAGQLKTMKETVIDPEQKRFETFLNRTLIKGFGDHKWKLKFTEFDPTTAAEDAAYFEKALGGKPWMRENEVREVQNLKPDEYFDNPQNVADDLNQIRKRLDSSLYGTSNPTDL